MLLVATSVSISAQTLREFGRLHTRPGVTILAAAVLDDVLGIIVLSLALGVLDSRAAHPAIAGHGGGSLVLLLVKIALFFGLGGLVGWKLLPPLVRWVSRFEAGTAVLATGIAIALGYAFTAEAAGLAGIIGAYLAGLMLSLTDFRKRLIHEVEHTAFAFFVPFFFESLQGWVDYFALADTHTPFQRLDEWLRRRLRMCLWKQWKKGHTRYCELRKLGLREEAAKMIVSTRNGYWRTAKTPQLHQALGNAFWAAQDLIHVAARYQDRRRVFRTAGCGPA